MTRARLPQTYGAAPLLRTPHPGRAVVSRRATTTLVDHSRVGAAPVANRASYARKRREPKQGASRNLGVPWSQVTYKDPLFGGFFDARGRNDEDPVVVVGLGYPSPLVEIHRYRSELFRISDPCPPHYRVLDYVRSGSAEGFHGGRLQEPARLLWDGRGSVLDGLLPSSVGTPRRQPPGPSPALRHAPRIGWGGPPCRARTAHPPTKAP